MINTNINNNNKNTEEDYDDDDHKNINIENKESKQLEVTNEQHHNDQLSWLWTDIAWAESVVGLIQILPDNNNNNNNTTTTITITTKQQLLDLVLIDSLYCRDKFHHIYSHKSSSLLDKPAIPNEQIKLMIAYICRIKLCMDALLNEVNVKWFISLFI